MSTNSNELDNGSSDTFTIPSQPNTSGTSQPPANSDPVTHSDSGLVYTQSTKSNKKLENKRRRIQKDNTGETMETDIEGDDDEISCNPIDLITKWPALGQGNHSVWTRTYQDWFKAIST